MAYVEVKETTYVLTLSEVEAQALRILTGTVTGSPMHSPRIHFDKIFAALKGAGAEYSYEDGACLAKAPLFTDYSGAGKDRLNA